MRDGKSDGGRSALWYHRVMMENQADGQWSCKIPAALNAAESGNLASSIAPAAFWALSVCWLVPLPGACSGKIWLYLEKRKSAFRNLARRWTSFNMSSQFTHYLVHCLGRSPFCRDVQLYNSSGNFPQVSAENPCALMLSRSLHIDHNALHLNDLSFGKNVPECKWFFF